MSDQQEAKSLSAEQAQKLSMAYLHSMKAFIDNETTLRREAIQRLLNVGKDINYECGYPDSISAADYRDLYDREGYGGRVVSIEPAESWRVYPEIYETDDVSNETEFEAAWKKLQNERQVFAFLERADVMSGIGRYGIVILGVGDGKTLDQPVEGINLLTGEKQGNQTYPLLYLRVLDEDSLQDITKKETDISSPRYGQPLEYTATTEMATGAGSTSQTQRIHWTRVIHIADNRGTSELYGTPRMQDVYNRLLDLRKILAGSGEMFWKGGFPGYAAEIDPSIASNIISDTDFRTQVKEDLKDTVELWHKSMQRILAVAGVKFKSLQPQVADPKGHVETHLKMIALAKGIPWRIFLGTEEAKLASGQDVRAWNGRIAHRQQRYLTPFVVRPTIDRLIAIGALPEPKEYFIEWPDLAAQTEQEQAEVAAKRTEAFAKYVTGDVAALISPVDYLMLYHGMNEDQAKEILENTLALEREMDVEPEPPEPPEPEEEGE